MIALLANRNACSRLRSSSDILLSRRHIVDGHSFRKQTSHFIRLDWWNNHARTTRLPISRCRHFLLSSQMQGIDDTQKFIKVATGGCWVQDGQLQFPVNKIMKEFESIFTNQDLLVWSNNKDCTAGQWQAFGVHFIGIHHAIGVGNWAVRIGNDWIRKGIQLVVSLDVLNPTYQN